MSGLLKSQEFYLWIKAFHIISVISWMAGCSICRACSFIIARQSPALRDSERFKVMEKKLLRLIVNPAMIATWIFGLMLDAITRAEQQHWFQAKFALVLIMSGIHGFYARCVKDFARDANARTQRFYRIINEVPAVLIIAIVILAVVKPF